MNNSELRRNWDHELTSQKLNIQVNETDKLQARSHIGQVYDAIILLGNPFNYGKSTKRIIGTAVVD